MPNVYIANYKEAELVMHAIRLKIFKIKDKKMSINERQKIRGGEIYCFDKSKVIRVTDNRKWSASKSCRLNNMPSYIKQIFKYKEVPENLTKTAIEKKIKNNEIDKDAIKKERKKANKIYNLIKLIYTIEHESETYLIVSYYCEIFARHTLMNLDFFKKLNDALVKYPELLSDNFVEKILKEGVNIFKTYNIDREVKNVYNDATEREQLEKDTFCFFNYIHQLNQEEQLIDQLVDSYLDDHI